METDEEMQEFKEKFKHLRVKPVTLWKRLILLLIILLIVIGGYYFGI